MQSGSPRVNRLEHDRMRRFLVVEDELIVGAHISWVLEDAGFEVIGPVGTVRDACDVASEESLDGATLDINLDGGRVDPVAEILAKRHIPFLFVTAYGRSDLPTSFNDSPLLNKPFNDQVLLEKIRGLRWPGGD
jgi:DNA-binding response OmpR family regulator